MGASVFIKNISFTSSLYSLVYSWNRCISTVNANYIPIIDNAAVLIKVPSRPIIMKRITLISLATRSVYVYDIINTCLFLF